MAHLIDLRCEGKLHGQLDVESLTLITAKGDWMYVYDLAATVRERRAVVVRLRAGDYNIEFPHLHGEKICGNCD